MNLSPNTLKELVIKTPNQLVCLKYRGVLNNVDGDHRPVMKAKDALNFANDLEGNGFKQGYIREMWVLDETAY
jgi:hypothetical protein